MGAVRAILDNIFTAHAHLSAVCHLPNFNCR